MEGVCGGVLGRPYVEEPQRTRLDFEDEMDIAAVGTHGRRRWEPRSTSGLAIMVSKAADAADGRTRRTSGPPCALGIPSTSTASWRY